MAFPLDHLYSLAAQRGCEITLQRNGSDGRWVASLGDDAASALTANGAVRALADKLAPRPVLTLCQREDAA